MRTIALLVAAMVLALALPLKDAYAEEFSVWRAHFKHKAVASGVEASFFDKAFVGVVPDPRVIELDGKQPERKNIGFHNYLIKVMSQKRIDDGRAKRVANAAVLGKVESAYAVPAEVVVALWGMETSYGANTGGFDLIRSLATLAWEGRRAAFFEAELTQSLLILQAGHSRRDAFKGSWAGAMGQNQFMPSSWARFAVDFNGDGHRDIWETESDVFASSANYLHKNGWEPSLKWGWRVVHAPVSYNKKTMTYREWLNLDVKFEGIAPRIDPLTPLTLIVPDGGDDRMYLVTHNFEVIKTWNRSNYFALSVGILSDLIAKGRVSPLSQSQTLYVNP